MITASQLNNDDRCRRLAYLAERWQSPAIRPTELLYSAIEAGLASPGETPWDEAEQKAMDLAVDRGVDSNQTDLLGQAEHLSSLASFITYILRPEGPWKRPEPIALPDGTLWHPGAFLSPTESHLRRVVLCSRWDAYRQVEEEHTWATLEGAIYGVPMDLMVVVLGPERDGRRHGPLSKGWTHPMSKQLRFRKRDGAGFDGNWQKVWREQSEFSRETWLDTLVEDGVLSDVVLVHTVQPEREEEMRSLAMKKMERIRETRELPEESPSQCFDKVRPCAFRSVCPRGLEPSPATGFMPTSHP